MSRRWSPTGRRIAALALLLAAALAASFALGAPGEGASEPERTGARLLDFDPASAPPPWRHRCPISVAAYEDGSASLHCAGHRRRFAVLDAESGRIRMRMPWARTHPARGPATPGR